LDPDARRDLLAHGESRWHAAGSLICDEGSAGDTLYIIESGRVAVFKDIGEQQPVPLGYRGPGEILGEMSIVGEQPRSASVFMDQGGRLFHIDAAAFSRLMNEHRTISWAILNVLNDRLQEADVVRSVKTREEETLSRQVVELTQETQRLAEAADARQETVELIVHDLRTPLAVVQGCLEILEPSVPEDEYEVIELAQRNSERVLDMLHQLLEAAQQEDIDHRLDLQPVDMRHLLAEALADIRTTAQSAQLDVTFDPADQLPLIVGDRAALRRVVGNLLQNATTYTPAGGHIQISARPREKAIEVSITDTGPGVPAEHRERIFQRFVRLPNSGGRRRGFGLGLYYCRQVVEAHHGHIWVEPGPGGTGSRFVFVLPLEKGETDD
jgi:signal transduction histidine kinase